MKYFMLPLIVLTVLFVGSNGLSQNFVLQLDGEDDCAEVYDAASLDMDGTMTIELWYWFS